jgi:molybdate transport system substrate-binding protein
VGQYSEEIYKSLGLWDALQKSGKITWGSNVKEVLSHVSTAAVDCGIVYGTDAATAKGVTVVASAPEGSHQPITYPAALLANAPQRDAAAKFLAFLQGKEARAVFTRIGFAIP